MPSSSYLFPLVAILAIIIRITPLKGQSLEETYHAQEIVNTPLERSLQQSDGTIQDYFINLTYCENNFDDFDIDENIVCYYDVRPADTPVTVTLEGLVEYKKTDNFAICTKKKPLTIVRVADTNPTDRKAVISIDKSQFNNALDIETYTFCIRNQIFSDPEKKEFVLKDYYTFIEMTFVKEGGYIFSINLKAVSEGGAGFDETPPGEGDTPGDPNDGGDNGGAGPRDPGAGEPDPPSFAIISYQCDVDTYRRSEEEITDGATFGVCVETVDAEVSLDSIYKFQMISLPGQAVTQTPITNGQGGNQRCGLENAEGQPNSKCFFRQTMPSKFFDPPTEVGCAGAATVKLGDVFVEDKSDFAFRIQLATPFNARSISAVPKRVVNGVVRHSIILVWAVFWFSV